MKSRVLNQFWGFINTPALWKNDDLFELIQFPIPYFNTPEKFNISSLIPSLATNFVLGKRIEAFFEFIISNSENYKVLEANLQIHKNKITLGEIDFLLKDLRRNRVLHIEIVYKFYVYDPSFGNEMERWIGPNRKDTLLKKVAKLKEHQLPILYKSETAETLKSLDIDLKKIDQFVLYKANLFVPLSLINSKFANINMDCIKGYWIPFSEFTSENYSGNSYFAPLKQDWLIDPKFQEEWYSFQEIRKVIQELCFEKRSPLIWMKDSEETYSRFFVVWW